MKQKIIFVVSLLFGLMFINGGLDKFFHYMPVPENVSEETIQIFTAFTTIGWLLPLVAWVEIIGGLLFIIPKTRALGAVVIFPIVVGIVFTNVAIGETTGTIITLIILAINLWVIYENRAKYRPMVQQ